jgi:hypothetical protein
MSVCPSVPPMTCWMATCTFTSQREFERKSDCFVRVLGQVSFSISTGDTDVCSLRNACTGNSDLACKMRLCSGLYLIICMYVCKMLNHFGPSTNACSTNALQPYEMYFDDVILMSLTCRSFGDVKVHHLQSEGSWRWINACNKSP